MTVTVPSPLGLKHLLMGHFVTCCENFHLFRQFFFRSPSKKANIAKLNRKITFLNAERCLSKVFSKVCFWTETITKILAPLRVVCKWQLNTLIENVVRFLKVSQVSPVIEDSRLLFLSISRWQVKNI